MLLYGVKVLSGWKKLNVVVWGQSVVRITKVECCCMGSKCCLGVNKVECCGMGSKCCLGEQSWMLTLSGWTKLKVECCCLGKQNWKLNVVVWVNKDECCCIGSKCCLGEKSWMLLDWVKLLSGWIKLNVVGLGQTVVWVNKIECCWIGSKCCLGE